MDTCFLCKQRKVPTAPPACKNASLRRAYEGIHYAYTRQQPVNVADYEVRMFEQERICLIQERYDPADPKISLTNSIETAIVLVATQYSLCPNQWTFVEHANMGAEKHSYQEYDMVVLTNDNIEWKYLWHNDYKKETEPYSDDLLIRRVEQYRNGASTVL